MPVYIFQHWGPFPTMDEVNRAKEGNANDVSIVSCANAAEANTLAMNFSCYQYSQRTGEPFRYLPTYRTMGAIPVGGDFLIMEPENSGQFSAEDIAEMWTGNASVPEYLERSSGHSLFLISFYLIDVSKPKGSTPAMPVESKLFAVCVDDEAKIFTMATNFKACVEDCDETFGCEHYEVPEGSIIWNPSNRDAILSDLGFQTRPV